MEYHFSNKIKNLAPSAIREILKNTADPNIISFAAGNPNVSTFPVEQLKCISDKVFENPSLSLQYGITEGYSPLINTVYSRLMAKGIVNNCDKLIITSGAQQAIDLSCKVLCNEGDCVICENPSFIGALNAFRSYNVNLVGVDMDKDGINLEKLEKAIQQNKNVRLLYLIPNFQNPTSCVMSAEKRKKVYLLAQKYNIVILEDDPYGEISFMGDCPASIKSYDTDGRVIYTGSFSKIISSGIRVGYVLANENIISKIVVAKQTNDVHTNIFFQIVIDEFIRQYDLDSHILSVRKLYKEKCAFMISCIEKYFNKRVIYSIPSGGIFLWVTLPDCVDVTQLCKKAIEKGVAVVMGSAFMADTSSPCHSIRLNYSTPTNEQTEKGIKILAQVIDEFLGGQNK